MKRTQTVIPPRNGALFDTWSVVHFISGALLGWIMDPFVALAILVLWEPLEVLVLSPLLMKKFGIIFGHETIRNSLSDIFFDTIGVAFGIYILTSWMTPPFILF